MGEEGQSRQSEERASEAVGSGGGPGGEGEPTAEVRTTRRNLVGVWIVGAQTRLSGAIWSAFGSSAFSGKCFFECVFPGRPFFIGSRFHRP